jgi:hypothetical protein
MTPTFTSHVRVPSEANRADAVNSTKATLADRILAALGSVTGLLLSSTDLVRVARRPSVTNALVGEAVLAVSLLSARWRAEGRHDS